MPEGGEKKQGQSLAEFLREGKRLIPASIRIYFARKFRRQKPSLTVGIGFGRKANALEEYRRRFPLAAVPAIQTSGAPAAGTQVFGNMPAPFSMPAGAAKGFGDVPVQPDHEPARDPQRAKEVKSYRQKIRGRGKRPEPLSQPSAGAQGIGETPEPFSTPAAGTQDFSETPDPFGTQVAGTQGFSETPDPFGTQVAGTQGFGKTPDPFGTQVAGAQGFGKMPDPFGTPAAGTQSYGKIPDPFSAQVAGTQSYGKIPDPFGAQGAGTQSYGKMPDPFGAPAAGTQGFGKMPDFFATPAATAQGLGHALAQPERAPAREPQRAHKPKPHHNDIHGYHWIAGIRGSELIAMTVACAIALGGFYALWTLVPRADRESPPGSSQTAQLPDIAGSASSSNKITFDRLTPEGAEAPIAPSAAAVPLVTAREKRAGGPAPEAPAAPKPDPAIANAPTVLHSERYLADGTRVDTPLRAPVAAADAPRPAVPSADTSRPAGPVPSVLRVGPGQVRGAPYLAPPQTAAETFVAAATAAPPEQRLSVRPVAVQAPAEPPPPIASGYYAQIKSVQDQKAAEADAAEVAEKYKPVLGDLLLLTRTADLKEKGIWYRVMAGPVKSHEEAEALCKKLKDAGIPACFVQKVD